MMNISILRFLAVSAFFLFSQCFHLDQRSEVEVVPAPPFQVIRGNTQRNRLDVWHPLRSSLAYTNNKVRERRRKKPAAQRRFGSDSFHYPEPAPGPGEKQSFQLGKLEESHERDKLNQKSEHSDGWLSILIGSLQSLVDPLLSFLRSFTLDTGLVSQRAEDRQSLVDSAQVRL